MSSQDLIFFSSTLFLLVMALVFNRVMRRRAETRQRASRFEKYRRDLDSLDRILQSNPDYTQAYWHKGKIYEAMNQLDEARRCFRIANTIIPKVVTPGDYAHNVPNVRQAALAAADGADTFSSTK